jgi:EAL domain-containing protein (putative c-di-GMP-specific phosphodiesterase class I)/CheY-like chemotaxis protein
MLVDDDPFTLRLLTAQLEQLSVHDVSAYAGGVQALDLISTDSGSFDVLFCDINMPGMDGVEFVRHLAERSYGGAVVLISGEDERTLSTVKRIARARRLNVLGGLRKPVMPEALHRMLEKARTDSTGGDRRKIRRMYGADQLRDGIVAGQLLNYYQPQIDLINGAMVGVETLVRWQHPEDGLVYPDQFIASAEENGLIDKLTYTVLDSALEQGNRWQGSGLNPLLSVNVSMENLAALDFPDGVAGALASARIPAQRVILEVTESQLTRNRVALLDIVTRLRLKRIRLSIDDFGTGCSSLAQLRDIPFDELKLDRSFVHGAARSPALRVIIESNVRMANDLGMRVVAEGVENDEDWRYIRGVGCHLAQGYFIARPMPGDSLPEWAGEWEGRRADLFVTEH